MDQLLGFGQMPQNNGPDAPLNDTAEQVYISSLALLKMLKHGKAGVPLEVMGIMLGDFVDDYTVTCIDVFPMPQIGTETTVESIDEKYQSDMLENLKQTGRLQNMVGWYHSHPGFGCFLSSVDVNTQKTFEQLHARCVAVVVDPIRSVRGKVVIDAFRSYGGGMLGIGDINSRQTTSNLGNIPKNALKMDFSKITYYSLLLNYKKNDLETKMLLNLNKSKWDTGFAIKHPSTHDDANIKKIDEINKLLEKYSSWIDGEVNKSIKDINLETVGKFNPRDHLENLVGESLTENINNSLTYMLNNLCF